MKFRVTFKTPDVTSYIEEYLDADFNDGDEKRYELLEAMKGLTEKFIEYDEYVTIEFDTDKQSATVVPLRKR